MEKLTRLSPNRIVTGEDLNALVDVINALVDLLQTQQELLQTLDELKTDARRTHTADRRGAKPI